MKTRHLFPLLLITAACATARVTTPTERQIATATLATVESTILVLHANGKMSATAFATVAAQIAELRATVAASEATPVGWTDIYVRVLNLAVQWLTQPR